MVGPTGTIGSDRHAGLTRTVPVERSGRPTTAGPAARVRPTGLAVEASRREREGATLAERAV